MASPLKGPAGNIEYLAHFRNGVVDPEFCFEESVDKALAKVRSQKVAQGHE